MRLDSDRIHNTPNTFNFGFVVIEFALGSGPKQSMPLGSLMQHAAVHGVHHRGQVAMLLRMLGKVPGNVDMLIYYER